MSKPNIILILNDDMGYSDLGCYGGEVQTPNLDSLAANGLRYTQFYNTARCCPSRASLLTGLYPHQADVGHMTEDDGVDGYLGNLNPNTVTIAEGLKRGGYATYMSGKWHVTHFVNGPKDNWPCQRGFDKYYGILTGAANYHQPRTLTRNNERIEPEDEDYFLTDVISDEAIRQIREHTEKHSHRPFFQYVAYTAPHWPLHAHPGDIAKYKGRYDAGWDQLRQERLQRMIEMGIIHRSWKLTERDPCVPRWEEADHKDWQVRRMEVYAAQIDRMDQGIGRILQALKDSGQSDNTLIVFLSDNGGCAEEIEKDWQEWITRGGEQIGTSKTRAGHDVQYGNDPTIMPGGEETYQSYGVPWANVSNTPFRLYKHWVHEGGIATPLIVHWPGGIPAKGELRRQPAQLPDIMATFLDLAGVEYPSAYNGQEVKPLEGFSLAPTFANGPPPREVLYWEHEGNKAVRKGKWKLVCKYPEDWELYDMEAGRTETKNIAADHPGIVKELADLYEQWARRCKVMPWDKLLELRKQKAAKR
ncbi:MAG: sulfatase-like hydrolase/transferase [Nitrospirae bacterium]|nr:sulfatase-like hydrolase/transferase [Nitrospirota bacterium]